MIERKTTGHIPALNKLVNTGGLEYKMVKHRILSIDFLQEIGKVRRDVKMEGGGEKMAQSIKRSINELLVNLFYHVMDMEAKAVITEEFGDITNNDMHIIEAIGVDEPRNMSAIAHKRSVTVSTLTTNMNGLEKKGYIRRERSLKDKRVVFVRLTEKGKKAFYHHRDFHKKMIKSIVRGLSEEEMEILYRCLVNLNGFFETGLEGDKTE